MHRLAHDRLPPLSRYILAAVLVGFVAALRVVVNSPVGDPGEFALFYLAMAIGAYYGGLGPGLLATGLSAIVMAHYLMDPAAGWPAAGPMSPVPIPAQSTCAMLGEPSSAPIPALEVLSPFTFDDWLAEGAFVVGGIVISSICESLLRCRERAQKALVERERADTAKRDLLTSERAARAEAERANRAKDEFLATLSHELRTPLNAILGWAQLLRAGSIDPKSMARGLEVIERNSRLQTQLIEDLLDMSRIVSGMARLDVRTVELGAVVDAAMECVRPAAQAKSIRLTRTFEPDAERVVGDPARLRQVLWNLLSNAIKFTPLGGSVAVFVARCGSFVELTVSDTGQGISPEFLPHVFERFRQADSSATRRHGGLGLGLALVVHLVELHGGSVHAISEGEGKGARFVVRLPVSTAPAHDRALNA